MLKQQGMDTGGGNVAHHIVGGDDSAAEFLGMDVADGVISDFLGGRFILNSYGAVNNAPTGSEGYEHGQKFHRDVRTYAGSFHLMLNMIVMVDAFTRENGGTYIVPESHRIEARPTDEEMLSRAVQLIAPAGSVVLFDSNTWHAAAPNRTKSSRWALTLTFTRPFMKQQMDYPRLLGEAYPTSERMRQLLGFNARVPSTMTEWYQPALHRMYKSDQG
jgi:ectoine hydroxylase-related dioxygenase (phytanoyl-CoA dioxygenase family)